MDFRDIFPCTCMYKFNKHDKDVNLGLNFIRKITHVSLNSILLWKGHMISNVFLPCFSITFCSVPSQNK